MSTIRQTVAAHVPNEVSALPEAPEIIEGVITALEERENKALDFIKQAAYSSDLDPGAVEQVLTEAGLIEAPSDTDPGPVPPTEEDLIHIGDKVRINEGAVTGDGVASGNVGETGEVTERCSADCCWRVRLDSDFVAYVTDAGLTKVTEEVTNARPFAVGDRITDRATAEALPVGTVATYDRSPGSNKLTRVKGEGGEWFDKGFPLDHFQSMPNNNLDFAGGYTIVELPGEWAPRIDVDNVTEEQVARVLAQVEEQGRKIDALFRAAAANGITIQ